MTQPKIEFDFDSRSNEIQAEQVIRISRTNLYTGTLSINVDEQTKSRKLLALF